LEDYSIPMSQKYIESRMKIDNEQGENPASSALQQLLSHTVLYEVYLVLEDCMK